MSGRSLGSPPTRVVIKIALFVKDAFDYFSPVLDCHVLFLLAVEPPVAVGTVEVAHIVDVNRAVHRLLNTKQPVCNHFLE